MRVMFVCSGNSKQFGMAPFIRSQGDSLEREGVAVSYFVIQGKGLAGYLKNIPKLYREYRDVQYDLVHAHYGLSALVALLALPCRPFVVSFMGSDVHGQVDANGRRQKNLLPQAVAAIVARFADHLIVKSPGIGAFFSKRKNVTVLPNGVDLERFEPMDQGEARRRLGLKPDGRCVLFLGNVKSEIKNFPLCRSAVERLEKSVELVAPYPCPPEDVAVYLSAADLLVVTSHHEGSPNVVKEAMACGCPVVSTDVGDVRWLLDGLPGCRVVGHDVEEVSRAIRDCLDHEGRTGGRERLLALGLDSERVAARLMGIYRDLTEAQVPEEAYGA